MNNTTPATRTNCAVYARTAATDQTTGSAAGDQILECRDYARKHGWTLEEYLVYADVGVSGLSTIEQRPAPDYPQSGLLYCGICGCRMTIGGKRGPELR